MSVAVPRPGRDWASADSEDRAVGAERQGGARGDQVGVFVADAQHVDHAVGDDEDRAFGRPEGPGFPRMEGVGFSLDYPLVGAAPTWETSAPEPPMSSGWWNALSRILMAALVSACASWPHFSHRKTAWLLRFPAEM